MRRSVDAGWRAQPKNITAEADRRRPTRVSPFSARNDERVGKSTLVADCAVMFLGWARQPASTGAIAPSTRGLSEAMARAIEFRKPGIVIELGGGTGAITRALLDSGLPPEDLVVVERNKRLYRLLRRRFPHVRILLADAASLDEALGREALGTISAVVSGLPLLSLPRKTRDAVLASASHPGVSWTTRATMRPMRPAAPMIAILTSAIVFSSRNRI